MTAEELGATLQAEFGGRVLAARAPVAGQLYVSIEPEAVVEIAGHLHNDLGCRFVITAGTDRRQQRGKFLITHFFAKDEDQIYLALHAEVDEDDPRIPSITNVVPGASWAEREFRDMVGVVPEGHPDPRRLVLADDWPEDLYPLRWDVEHGTKPPLSEGNAMPRKAPPKGSIVVPLGPFFPSLEEPAYFRLFVENEKVVGADYRGFYNHRGIEKMGCSVLTYNQIPFIAERICGICGLVHSTAYCQAVEQAGGIEVPLRAKYIRTILLELERTQSHLLWLGIAGHLIGFDTVLMQTWRMREPLMWLCERLTGNRKTYGTNVIGGVRRDIEPDAYDDVLRIIGEIEQEWKALCDAIPGDSTLMGRLRGTGVLPKQIAVERCAVGPTARGSGVEIDVRVDHPYAAYDRVEVKKCVYDGCDNLARTLVRLDETLDSVSIIRQALADIPDGPILADVGEDIPAGHEAMSAVEAPRGEVFHWVLTGEENRPERWRARAPTYANLQVVPPMIEGSDVAHVPISIGSFDPCFSCTDRMEVLDIKSGQVRVCSGEDLTANRDTTEESR